MRKENWDFSLTSRGRLLHFHLKLTLKCCVVSLCEGDTSAEKCQPSSDQLKEKAKLPPPFGENKLRIPGCFIQKVVGQCHSTVSITSAVLLSQTEKLLNGMLSECLPSFKKLSRQVTKHLRLLPVRTEQKDELYDYC